MMDILKSARRLISRTTKNRNFIDIIETESDNHEWLNAIPYAQVPGPKPVPLLGNSWRFIPFIGESKDEIIIYSYIGYKIYSFLLYIMVND